MLHVYTVYRPHNMCTLHAAYGVPTLLHILLLFLLYTPNPRPPPHPRISVYYSRAPILPMTVPYMSTVCPECVCVSHWQPTHSAVLNQSGSAASVALYKWAQHIVCIYRMPSGLHAMQNCHRHGCGDSERRPRDPFQIMDDARQSGASWIT